MYLHVDSKQKRLASRADRTDRWRQVLSGCGVYDGAEVHEASACLVHLSRAGAAIQCYAPDIKQMHVIDHTKVLSAPSDLRYFVFLRCSLSCIDTCAVRVFLKLFASGIESHQPVES